MDIAVTRWFDENFPPLAIYHGGCDFLVATEPLLSRIDTQEPHVRVIRVEKLEKSEVNYLLCSNLRCSDFLSHLSTVISTLQVSFQLTNHTYLYSYPITHPNQLNQLNGAFSRS